MARKRRPLPIELRRARIESVDPRGRGIALVDERRVHLPSSLPGELVEFRYTRRARRSDDGRVERVLEAAPERVVPKCDYFDVCGGCRNQHVAHPRQIASAQADLLERLESGGIRPPLLAPPVLGPLWGYRRRARLAARLVPKKGGVLVGFREKISNYVAEMSACEVLVPAVGGQIDALRTLLSGMDAAASIPQIEVAAGDHTTGLVFRHLEPLTERDIEALRRFERSTGIWIFLQPGGLATVEPLEMRSTRELSYRLAVHDVTIRFLPTDFVQVNAEVNRQLVDRALAWLEPELNERILDMFCGLGNFTLPMARRGARVRGIEANAGLVARARANAVFNRISTVEFDVDNLFEAETIAKCLNWNPVKLLLDPPRGGAEGLTLALADRSRRRPSRIVYVSCSPETFARDAGSLVRAGYRLAKVGVVDMFPHTGHIETIGRFDLP